MSAERLKLSRETLYKYRTLPNGTRDNQEWLLARIREELATLNNIAQDAPELAEAISLLADAWRAFAEVQKMRAH